MALVDLIKVPENDGDWESFYWNHRDSHDRIRKAIQTDSGVIQSFTITNGGSGYTTIPSIIVQGGAGSGVQINVTITGGVLTSLQVINGGTQYSNPVVIISGGGGTGASAIAESSPFLNLEDYIIYPVDKNNIKNFLENNQNLHSDMDGALGLQSSDLQDVNFDDENQKKAWFYSHYQEHFNAESTLGI